MLWALLAVHGTQAKLAAFLGEDSGRVSRLLYGDRKAGRVLSIKLREYGVAIELWDQPLPDGWTLPHVSASDSSPSLSKCESTDTFKCVTAEDIKRAAGG